MARFPSAGSADAVEGSALFPGDTVDDAEAASERCGVRVVGRALPGTVVAFYPGHVYPHDRLPFVRGVRGWRVSVSLAVTAAVQGDVQRELEDLKVKNLMARINRTLIDGIRGPRSTRAGAKADPV